MCLLIFWNAFSRSWLQFRNNRNEVENMTDQRENTSAPGTAGGKTGKKLPIILGSIAAVLVVLVGSWYYYANNGSQRNKTYSVIFKLIIRSRATDYIFCITCLCMYSNKARIVEIPALAIFFITIRQVLCKYSLGWYIFSISKSIISYI